MVKKMERGSIIMKKDKELHILRQRMKQYTRKFLKRMVLKEGKYLTKKSSIDAF